MLIVLTILSILSITAYTAVVCIAWKGVPNSISATFYKLKHKAWFTLTMYATAFLLMPAILEVTPSSYQFVAFLACAGMMLVGAAPCFKEHDKAAHITGAVMCIVLSQVWVMLTCPLVLLAWFVYIDYTVYMINKKWTGNLAVSFMQTKPMFWIEITALFATYLTLFLQ